MTARDIQLEPRTTRRTLLTSFAVGGATCLLGGIPAGAAPAARLPRATPEEVGIGPDGILKFIEAVEQKVGGLHSFMLMRHGKVAAEGWWAPYRPERPHMLYSLSKSFCSTGVGLAVAENRLSADDPVVKFFPDDLPAKVSDNLAEMRVKHLLMMGTGHDKDSTGPVAGASDGNWVKAFLALPVEHRPGSKFVYNSGATYMCSAIVQKVTGMKLVDYLTPRLFQPLGIEGAVWESCPRGINVGGWGLNVKTEDIARFGQLYLQRGKWRGRQLVPESWIAQATSKQISNGDGGPNDWAQGYGYQFWRCRNDAYRGDGAFGQYCVVMPKQDAVLAITSGVGDMQAVLNAAWDHLLPAMETQHHAHGAETADLKPRLARLAVRAPEGKAISPLAKQVSGKTYRFEEGAGGLRSLKVEFDGKRCVAHFGDDRGVQKLEADASRWVNGEFPIPAQLPTERKLRKVAARGAWTTDDTYALKLCFVETPYIQTMTLKFDGDRVTLGSKLNVAFGPTSRPDVVGRVEG